jgi:hypothetical protein
LLVTMLGRSSLQLTYRSLTTRIQIGGFAMGTS